jgi:hypothetical protein
MQGRYSMGPFQGTVALKDWFADPISGRTIRGITGKVTVMEAKDMIGFDPGKSEANWVARVEGETTSYNFPGCQVRAVITHEGITEPNSGSESVKAA